jgi:ABC-2 type transport system ATP-binding protein
MQDSLLHIENLSKSYGKIKALKGLDIEIRPGKVYGLLGPNGSGKSTTLGHCIGHHRIGSG